MIKGNIFFSLFRNAKVIVAPIVFLVQCCYKSFSDSFIQDYVTRLDLYFKEKNVREMTG